MANTIPCGRNNNIDDGCMRIFSAMVVTDDTVIVLCQLCKKLREAAPESAAQIESTYKQCDGCGVCGTRVTNPCGSCERQGHGMLNASRQEASDGRKLSMEQRIKRPLGGAAGPLFQSGSSGSPAAPASPSRSVSAPTSTSGHIGASANQQQLLNLRGNSGRKGFITINYECRRSDHPKSIDSLIGTGCNQYDEDITMFSLQEVILKSVNAKWTTNFHQPLTIDEVELRGPKNLSMESVDDMSMTLTEWYQKYSALTDSEEDEEFLVTPKRRRGQSTALKSMFRPDAPSTATPLVVAATNIGFTRISCFINEDTSQHDLIETTNTEMGTISRAPLVLSVADRGRTKDVYKLVISGSTYVAKKLVDIGNGRSSDIGFTDSLKFLSLDLIRLKRMAHFMGKFQSVAAEHGVETAKLLVSDAFIIKTKLHVDDVEHTAYLVEPLRMSTTVVKFSGTNTVAIGNDQKTVTAGAFAHYVLADTACQYLFVDIQGSYDIGMNMVLFDPMTHTPAGYTISCISMSL
ncbi:hypothetical protein EUX98_g3365 [Antrodiella citrinella]|uniref:Alpha-type protein kinase domain-containing protein n=1 Tax=Antrodiella citrinella TaxID=2447956 RepID=A0A4S4MWQ4_9APHY|nr:hypothetical protein EUX98_g3365 [Antrodiella citrinella]